MRNTPTFIRTIGGTLFFVLLALSGLRDSAAAQIVAAPVLNTISPNFGSPGDSFSVALTGANLLGAAGASVSVSGGGVTITGIGGNSSALTVTFTIDTGASLGYRQVTVTTTPGGTSNSRTFTVLPASAGGSGSSPGSGGSSTSAALPVLNSISPNFGNVGSSAAVTLTGVNLAGAAAVVVSGNGVTTSNVNATSTSVTATVVIAAGASLGYRQITVTTPLGTSNGRTFTVGPPLPAPTLNPINPNFGYPGNVVDVTLTGSNFVPASGATSVAVSGAGVTAGSPSGVTSSAVTVRLTIAANATLGPREVTVTTPSGTSNAMNFNVASTVPAPALNTIAPNFGNTGRFVDVTLAGANFVTQTGTTSIAVSGTGVTVNNVGTCYVCHDGRRDAVATATLAISPGASLGYRQLMVTTPGGTSNTRTFTILAASEPPLAPALTGMSLNVGDTGQQVSVTLTGTNFVPEQTEVLADGIVVSSVNPVNATTLTASFTLPAVAGLQNVRVRTPGGTSTDSIAFTVRATITSTAGPGGSISPSGTISVNPGASQTFMITPDTGYGVGYISVDGSSVGPAASYTFSNVTSNHTIAVTFAINTSSSWTTLAPMPTARLNLHAAEIGGRLYAVGGAGASGDTSALEVYDPSTNVWSALKPLPDQDGNSGRRLGTVGVIDGKLYLAGGFGTTLGANPSVTATSSLQVYDPAADSWSTGRLMPALSANSTGGVIERKLYVLSPSDGSGNYRYDFYAYDPDTDTWAIETSSPAIHVGAAAVVLNGKLYVIGGYDGAGKTGRVDVFDPATHSWTNVQSMPTGRDGAVAAVIGGKIYVAGGYTNAPTSITEVYDPSTNTWTAGDSLPAARYGAAGAAIDGKFYIVGGWDGTNVIATLQVSSPTLFDSNIGGQVANCDDCWVSVALPFPFTFFGQTYTNVFVNNNGHLTFNFGEWDYTETVAEFNGQPRISAFWDDLIWGGGLYVNSQIPGKFIVTWFHQQEFCCVGDSTIQATLFPDGRIQFAYNGVTSLDAIVGITPGGNVPLQQVDFSGNSPFSINGATAILEQFAAPAAFGTTDPAGSGTGANHPFDLDHHSLLVVPNASGGYDITFHTPTPTTTGTAEGTVYDSSGNPVAAAEVAIRSSGNANFNATATTDSNGRYRVTNVIVGAINVVRIVDGNNAGRGAGHLRGQGETLVLDVHPLSSQVKQQQ